MSAKQALVLFARLPVAGSVKTRLISFLGAEKACELYLAFIEDLVSRFTHTESFTVHVAAACDSQPLPHPAGLPPPFSSLPCFAQTGESLGDRMADAFRRLFGEGYDKVVLIGSDSPTLPLGFVAEAFQALEEKEVVLGPAVDGGYYLIGAKGKCPAILEGIDWGTDRVLSQTINLIKRQNLTVEFLNPWYDVDDQASLLFLTTHLQAMRLAGQDPAPRTRAILEQGLFPTLTEDSLRTS